MLIIYANNVIIIAFYIRGEIKIVRKRFRIKALRYSISITISESVSNIYFGDNSDKRAC